MTVACKVEQTVVTHCRKHLVTNGVDQRAEILRSCTVTVNPYAPYILASVASATVRGEVQPLSVVRR